MMRQELRVESTADNATRRGSIPPLPICAPVRYIHATPP